MTIKELKEKLSEAGLPFPVAATKPQLEEIYDKALEDGVFDGEDTPEAEAPSQEPAADGDVTTDLSVEEPPVEEEPAEDTEISGEFTVLSTLSHDGKMYELGESVKLEGKQARRLLELGVIK